MAFTATLTVSCGSDGGIDFYTGLRLSVVVTRDGLDTPITAADQLYEAPVGSNHQAKIINLYYKPGSNYTCTLPSNIAATNRSATLTCTGVNAALGTVKYTFKWNKPFPTTSPLDVEYFAAFAEIMKTYVSTSTGGVLVSTTSDLLHEGVGSY